MVYNKERENHVADLCDAAGKCGVARIRLSSSAQVVATLAENIKLSEGANYAKRQAEEAFAKYQATFKPEVSSGSAEPLPAAETVDKQIRLRGTSFLLNYNWDFFGKPLPDGTPASADAEALWILWLAWKKRIKKELDVVKSSSTLEESLRSCLLGRVHFHWKVVAGSV